MVPKDPPSAELQAIINLFSQGLLQQALTGVGQMLKRFPNSFSLYNIAGASNTGLMQFDAAINSFEQALKIKPDSADVHNNMGIALNNKGDLEAALDCYNNALKLKPNDADVYNNIGNALKDNGDLDAAVGSFKKAISINPNYAKAYNNMGAALKDKGDLEAAVNNFRRAITLNPNLAEAYSNLGSIMSDLGRSLEAEVNYRQAIALKPDYAEAYGNMGAAQQELGRFVAAEASYRKAIALKPDYPEAYNNIGNLLRELGRYEAAEASYRCALTIKLGYVEATYNLGVLLYESKQFKKAAEQFTLIKSIKSKYYLLRCFYLLDQQSSFYDQLDYLINRGEINAVIGSMTSRSEIKYGINKPNPFCYDPLKYVLKTDLTERCDFKTIFVQGATGILDDDKVQHKCQTLLTNGIQTGGNIFAQGSLVTDEIQNIIHTELEKYRVHFKDSTEGLITNWPTDYNVYGWLVSMKSGGELAAHMHDTGWITGSIYINVPPKSMRDSGNLVVCIDHEKDESDREGNRKSIDVVTGNLCLFPASLLHYTVPFESEEDRIVLAFDVIPNN